MFIVGKDYSYNNIVKFAERYSEKFEYVKMLNFGDENLDENIIQLIIGDYTCTFIYTGYSTEGGQFSCIHQSNKFFDYIDENSIQTMVNTPLLEKIVNDDYSSNFDKNGNVIIQVIIGYHNDVNMHYLSYDDVYYFYYENEDVKYDIFILEQMFDSVIIRSRY